MMSFEEAVAHAKRELCGATHQAETSPYPGIVAINNVRAEWLSRLIAAAERAEKLEDELRKRQEKISVETPLGRLEAVLGWDHEAYPEIYTQLVRKDGVEIDLVACTVDVEKAEANAYLYADTSTDCWTKRHTWTKEEINIEE